MAKRDFGYYLDLLLSFGEFIKIIETEVEKDFEDKIKELKKENAVLKQEIAELKKFNS